MLMLSVYLSMCLCKLNSKYPLNVLKFIDVIFICYSMDRTENGIHIYRTNGLSTETHKSFPIHYGLWAENF